MNKILSLMACALVGFSASAEVTSLYVAGPSTTTVNGVALGDWDIVNTVEVTLNRGKFTLNCENMESIAISDKKLSEVSWGNWKTGLWAPVAITENDLGKPVALVGPGDANFQVPWKGNWKLEIAQDLSTVTVTTTTPKPEATYHLVGNFSWSPIDAYKFEKETDTVYWLDITEAIGSTHYLNILRNSSWNEWWSPAMAPIVANETAAEWRWKTNQLNDDAYAIPDGSTYTGTIRLETPAQIIPGCTVQVTFYPTLRKHTSGVADALVEEQNAPAEYFNLQGVKISAPQNGQLYIVRRGASVSKEIAK